MHVINDTHILDFAIIQTPKILSQGLDRNNTVPSDCGSVLKTTVEINLIDFAAHFWQCFLCGKPGLEFDPRRLVEPEQFNRLMPSFLYGESRRGISYYSPASGLYYPLVVEAKRGFNLPGMMKGLKVNFHPVGGTAAVKFFTLENVTDVKSSAAVYLAPLRLMFGW